MSANLKVLDWLSELNALLVRKLPLFLSRLNEINGGRRKNMFSFVIITENFEVFANNVFDCKVL